MRKDVDYAIVGGGIVGLCVAFGLLSLGRRVLVLDGEDDALRASRGNFGLVWVQSKGLREPRYAAWSQRSAGLWRGFAEELFEHGADVALRQDGGFDHHLDEAGLEARVRAYEGLREALGGDYPFEVLRGNALRREEPAVGPRVVGAILHHQDGHVNPLKVLAGLAAAVRARGGMVETGVRVATVESADGGFRLCLSGGGERRAARVALCAGLGAAELGPQLGFRAPVRPQRGQVLITERLAPLLRRPSGTVRQVDEGGVQIGDSQEEVGFDDRETLDVTAGIAARAVALFPALARARLVRSWAALRVMSPDGLPIYQRSERYPGAFLVNCHSGVTLAAAHARLLPLWLEERADAPDLEVFGERRFAPSPA